MSETDEKLIRYNAKLKKAYWIFVDAFNNGVNGTVLTDDILIAVMDLIEEHFELIEEEL